MPVLARSLVNYAQTISGQTIPAMGQRVYGASTSALTTAQTNGTVKLSTYVDPQAQTVAREQKTQFETHLTGETMTIDDDTDVAIYDGAGTLATATINMPAAPFDGMRVTIAATVTLTGVTHNAGAGQTLKGGLTAGVANAGNTWVYRAANTTWYKIG